MKKHYRTIFFIIGLAGIILLAIKANPDRLDWMELFTPQLPLLLVVLLLLWTLIYTIHAKVFRLIMGEEATKISRLDMFRICITGFALNNVTPAGLIGSEPYRILELKNYVSTEKATSSTITFSLMFVLGHFLLWLTGILIYIFMGCPGSTLVTVLLIGASFLLLGVCLYFMTYKQTALAVPVLHLLAKFPFIGKRVAAYTEKNQAMLSRIDQCYAEFHEDRKLFFTVTLLEYLARILEGVEYFLIFVYLGESVSILGGILILSLASLMGNLLFMVPMQAGTREGGMAIALDILGTDFGTGVMGGLIFRVRDLICTVVGIALIIAGQKKKTDGAKEPIE